MSEEEHVGRQLSHEVLEQYRFRAVKLWQEGKKINEIASLFGVHRVTVSDWISLYKKKGKRSLYSRKAPGPKTKLDGEEMKRVVRALKNSALDYGFETPLWTCGRLRQIIAQETGKKLHVSSVWHMLQRWGYSNQKPARRALQADKMEEKKWLNDEWPKIREKAGKSRAIVYFQDEAGVSLTAVLGKTWALKGKTPLVETTGSKGGYCLSSAISPTGRMVFRFEKDKVNSSTFIDFLTKLIAHHKNKKIILICDGAPAHRAKAVGKFVESNSKHFDLYRLPSYSPHLNPDELVWRHLKQVKLKSHQIRTKKEFKPFVHSKMKSIQMSRNLVKSFFLGSYVV